MTPKDPVDVIQELSDAHGSVASWARSVGLTPSYVHDILRRRRPPSDKVLAVLGLSRVVVKS